jgi:hypothetical protein
MCGRIERLVVLKLTTEVGFRDLWERCLEVILGDSKSEKSSWLVEEGTYEG